MPYLPPHVLPTAAVKGCPCPWNVQHTGTANWSAATGRLPYFTQSNQWVNYEQLCRQMADHKNRDTAEAGTHYGHLVARYGMTGAIPLLDFIGIPFPTQRPFASKGMVRGSQGQSLHSSSSKKQLSGIRFSHILAIKYHLHHPHTLFSKPSNQKASHSRIPVVTISNKWPFFLHSTNQSAGGCWTLKVIVEPVILSFRPSAAQPTSSPITTAIRSSYCIRVTREKGLSVVSPAPPVSQVWAWISVRCL